MKANPATTTTSTPAPDPATVIPSACSPIKPKIEFGDLGSQNPAIQWKDQDWPPGKIYPVWLAFTFQREIDCTSMIPLIQAVSRISRSPIETKLSTLFLPEVAGETLRYLLGESVEHPRIPKELLRHKKLPEITRVYHKDALIKPLQAEVAKLKEDPWFKIVRPQPSPTSTYSKIFLSIDGLDEVTLAVFKGEPKFRALCRIVNM